MIQHYKIKASVENIKLAHPGMFVYDDYSGDTIGFVDFVSDTEMAIMLFEPTELSGFKYTKIADTADWETRLNQIFDEFPDVKSVWLSCCDDDA